MAPKDLYVDNSSQVSSHTVIDADLGVDDRHLLVMSGLAWYDWNVDSDSVLEGEVCVHKRQYARNLEHASPFVGLAGIANDESEFVFAADLARVDLDESTGEIRLWIHTALQGEESHFQWIAYQVVATYVHVGTSIEGTIRWPTSLMTPASHFPSAVEPHFKIFANHREMSAGTSELQPWEVLTPVVQGHVERLSVASGECTAHYRIENPPMAMPLKVTVTVDSAFASRTVVAERSAGPEIFTLSPMQPSEVVDFMLAGLDVR